MRHILIGTALALIGLPAAAHAEKAAVYTGTFSNAALSGYDAVAYFTEGKPVEGSSKFSTKWKGVEWRFASAANLAAFKANPEKFAPQFGGYCAWAVSKGYTASGDPKVWKVVNGKLYLNYNEEVGRKWSQDIPGNIASADKNWPTVLTK
jgi:YHS domain-containing protein